MRRYDVLCVGSATLDTFLRTTQPFSSIHLGDKILVDHIERHSGGGATNAAATLAKWGLKTKVLTKIGKDHDADFVERELKEYKIKNIALKKSTKNTDTATIISSTKEKDRIIYVHKGASQDLRVSDYNVSDLNSKWIYLATLVGKSLATAKKIATQKAKATKLLFNPSLYLAQKGASFLRPILSNADILILNREEAQALLKLKSKNIKLLLVGLRAKGPKTVVITNSRKGFDALQNTTHYVVKKTPGVPIIHTAGAGDAFSAGLLAATMRGYPLEKALALAQANSSSVIQYIGTKNKLLSESQALRFVKKYKIKIATKKI